MGNFNSDNKFISGLNKTIDCVWLGILWTICSIPIITSGAASTALYYSINKSIRHDRGYVTSSFFSSFKQNFKQSTLIWIVILCLYALLGYDYYVMKSLISIGEEVGYLYKAFPIFMIFITLWGFYIFPYIARFHNTTKETLINSLFIAVRNIHWTILIAGLFILSLIVLYMFPPIFFVLPVMYNLFKNSILERVFEKYISPEERLKEFERNRNFYN